MRIPRVALAWLLLTGSSCALAHAHLTQSSPVQGEQLPSAPHELDLHFSEAAQLTALWIQKQGSARQKLGPFPDRPQDHLSIALPPLDKGAYLVSWRILAGDGHVSSGELRFTVN